MTETLVDPRIGAPASDVTHWGIVRLSDMSRRVPSGRRKPTEDRLSHPCEDGVRIATWPIEDCTLDVIRERWSHGTFRVLFYCWDEVSPADDRKPVPRGKGHVITIDEPEEDPEDEAPPVAAPALPVGGDAAAMLSFAQAMMTMSDTRTSQMLDAMLRTRGPAETAPGTADLRAELAGMRATIEANEQRRTIEEAHRAALAAKDAEILELRRQAERAEESDSGPTFEPGTPFLEQLPTVLANAFAAIALKSPETAVQLLGAAKGLLTPSSPPPAVAAPPPAPVAVPRTRHVPPPPADVDEYPRPAPFPGSTTPVHHAAPPIVHVVPSPPNGARARPAAPPSAPTLVADDTPRS